MLFVRVNWKIFGRIGRAMIEVISWVLPDRRKEWKVKM